MKMPNEKQIEASILYDLILTLLGKIDYYDNESLKIAYKMLESQDCFDNVMESKLIFNLLSL